MKKILIIVLAMTIGCSNSTKQILSSKKDVLDLLEAPSKLDVKGSLYRKNELYQMHVSNFSAEKKIRKIDKDIKIEFWIPTIRDLLVDAKKFNVPLVVFGDSNAFVLTDDLRSALLLGGQFGGVVNVAIGGTTASDWNRIFNSNPDILFLLNSFKYQVVSIGGNHVVMKDMENVKNELKAFRENFPRSILLNIPKLETDRDENIKGKEMEFSYVNDLLLQNWGEENVIDTYKITNEMSLNGTPIFTDGIHFISEFDILHRIPKIIEKIYIQKISSGDL